MDKVKEKQPDNGTQSVTNKLIMTQAEASKVGIHLVDSNPEAWRNLMSFHLHGDQIGKIFFNENDQIDFEGNFTESARLFVNESKRIFDENRS